MIGGRSPITAMAVLLCTACAQLPQAEPETPAGAVSRVIRVAAAATPEPRDDAWARVRSGFRLPNMSGRLVKQWEQHYSSQPEYVARMMQRASVLLYHVLEEVERRNLPTEIALLPMIESAYNPQAYSRSHASGMWQFMPSTGRHYGLRQDFWHDERRDVLAATDAALDYLQKLHRRFGDWKLALAAYNWGQGNLSRAIAENRAKGLPTSYENLALPPETRKYLPKLQAVKNMIANPQDCVWTRLLTPKDLQETFLFPGGNLDHTMLVAGQTYFDRGFSPDPETQFYRLGGEDRVHVYGAGTYPCGSVAGTPGYMCATQLLRTST